MKDYSINEIRVLHERRNQRTSVLANLLTLAGIVGLIASVVTLAGMHRFIPLLWIGSCVVFNLGLGLSAYHSFWSIPGIRQTLGKSRPGARATSNLRMLLSYSDVTQKAYEESVRAQGGTVKRYFYVSLCDTLIRIINAKEKAKAKENQDFSW